MSTTRAPVDPDDLMDAPTVRVGEPGHPAEPRRTPEPPKRHPAS